MRSLIPLALAGLILGGCATQPLPPIDTHYEGHASIKTDRSVRIDFTTGEVTGFVDRAGKVVGTGTTFISVPTGDIVDQRFGAKQQKETCDLLANDLIRLGIVRSVAASDSSAPADLSIRLDFIKTENGKISLSYVLDVNMTLQAAGKSTTRNYHIDVWEQDNANERWHSTVERNKTKAIKRLLEKAIPDIEDFLVHT